MNQARGKRETGKTEARRLMERKAAQQNKNTSEELKQGLQGTDRLTKQGEERLTSLATESDPLPPIRHRNGNHVINEQ